MKIKTFILLFNALILVLFVALTAALVYAGGLFERRIAQLQEASDSIRSAENLKSALLTHNRDALLYAMSNDPARLASRRSDTAEIQSHFLRMESLVGNREEAAALESVKREVEEYLELRRRLEAIGMAPLEQYVETSGNVDDALLLIDRYILANEAQRASLLATIDAQNQQMRQLGAFLLVLGGALLLGLFLAVILLLARPMSRVAGTISRYAGGETSARVRSGGLREIERIGAQFNRMADSLEEQRKQRLSFIASIAHDLRNPLHVIATATQLLALKCGEEDREIADSVTHQIRFLDTLVGDLLDASRIEAGQFNLQPHEEDILPQVREAVDLQKSSASLHAFILDLPPEPVRCRFDPRLMSQVLHNLLSNAVKYSPGGGEILIRGERRGGRFLLAVSDRGIGIDAVDLEDIFKPFHRSGKTRDTIPGIGLGLAASRRIMEAHEGELLVQSTPGEGSTFTAVLPLSEAGV